MPMMVNCPKCGFNQPDDRYCAKCGVDMLAYKPAAKPLSQRLLSKWWFPVVIVSVLGAFAIGGYALFNTTANRALETDFSADANGGDESLFAEDSLRRAKPLKTSSANPTGTGSGEEASQQDPALSRPNSASTLEAAPGGAANSATAGFSETSATGQLMKSVDDNLSDAQTRGEGAAIQKLHVRFVEVQRTAVNEFVSAARNVSTYESFSGGVLPDLSARLKSETLVRRSRSLENPSQHTLRVNQPIVIFKGARDDSSDQNVGVTLQILPLTNDDSGSQLQVEVIRLIRDSPGAAMPTERIYQEVFTVSRGGGIFLAGILPRRSLNEDEVRFYSSASILRIMTSSAFQNASSEFVIFLEAL